MNLLLEIIGEFVFSLIWDLIPSKKGKIYRKNLKILKQQDWFRQLMKKYKPIFLMNESVRAKIFEYNNNVNLANYRTDLEQLAKRELG
ncbi:hypothetical protein [Terribacillus sp. DMT04]|uniref:hypothetical protein n=1 Tax=Terribacillus sp. DMT04 TaxID=2850441 RepID=UPI001C2C64C6|nr:hypothetical protein [Terribacillus sp. DMT04]QXE01962.1 hypothetical protein KS242_01530 [Terribacillus sp. DMT04]